MTDALATMSDVERVLFLRKVPLFAELAPQDLRTVASVADERAFVDGETIAGQGDPGDELHIVVDGEVRVVRVDPGTGSEMELAKRTQGDVVGEMALITQEPRMASLVASGEVRTLRLGRTEFEGVLRERPDTAIAVIRVLSLGSWRARGAARRSGQARQSMLTTRTGCAMPFRETARSSEHRERDRLRFDGFAGHDDLTGLGERADPCRLVHAHPRVVVDHDRRLRRVQPDPHLWGEPVTRVDAPPAAAGSRRRTTPRRARPANVAKNPSPVVCTISPRCDSIADRSVSSCQRTTSSHASSPIVSSRFVDPTMSVNMNVRATRRPVFGAPASIASRHRAASSVAPKPLERRVRGPQLQSRRCLVAVGSVGHREVSTRLRGLEREVGVGPVTERLPELGDRTRGVALVGEDLLRSPGARSRATTALRSIDAISRSSSAASRASATSWDGQRDLDLRREQACPHQRQWLIGERRADRRASRDRAPSGELQERQPGLRVVPTLMRLCERLLGPVEVADPQPDLPDLMEAHARDRQLSERDQLLHRVASLDLRVGERSAEAHDLRPPHAAVAGEAADRLALAPASRRLGPLAGTLVVREVPAHDDRHAVDDPGRAWGELSSDRRDGGLVDQRHALVRPAPCAMCAIPCTINPNACRSWSSKREPMSSIAAPCSIRSSTPEEVIALASSRYPCSTLSGCPSSSRDARWNQPAACADCSRSLHCSARCSATYAARRGFPSRE